MPELLEKALHCSLRLVSAEVPDSPGDEWFLTSPARVEQWFDNFQKALSTIAVTEPDPSKG